MPSSSRRRIFAAALLSLAASGVCRAAAPPLADRVPADALVYLGWTGADGCPGYGSSHLKAVVDASAVPQLGSGFLPQLVRRLARLDEQAGAAMQQALDTTGPMWRHPTAFYFAGVDYPPGGRPTPRVALLCDAGADARMLAQQLSSLVAQLPPDAQPRPTVTVAGSLVRLSIGTTTGVGQLATAANFTAALGQCKPDGAAMVGYVDVQAMVAAIDTAFTHGPQTDAQRLWPKAKQTLGLSGLRRAAMTAGFDGRDWVERQFASTDGSKTGVLALFDARPLDADLLSVVPRSADRVSASRFDVAAGFDALRDAVGQFNPDAAQQVDGAIGQVDQMAGINVRRDLLGSVGDQWVTYADRGIGGTGLAGNVLMNRLRDPARADAAMLRLSRRLNTIVAQQLHNPNVEVTFREQALPDGTVLHYLAVPLVTPTWAIKGDMLYVGLYPQTVAAALDEAAHHGTGGSILQRPEFVALQKRLGGHPSASFSFDNLPAMAPDGYGDLLSMSRLWLGMGDLIGAHPPALVVPSLRQVMAELSPAGASTWADAAGWHAMAVSPFPGAEAVTAGGGGVASMYQQAMVFGALGQAMQQANRPGRR